MQRIVALALLVVAAGTAPAQTVSVMYAGSLVTVMENAVAPALSTRGIVFEGEPRGSREIATFILSGLRHPDAVIIVDPSILDRLQRAGTVAHSWSLGSASLGLATPLCGTGDERCLRRLLRDPSLRIARTDPRLDPKGRYTIDAVRLLLGASGERSLLGDDENPAQIFPEQDLLVRLETHEANAGFVYSTEVLPRGLHFIALPGRASMSSEIRYFAAIMKGAPHPGAARAFVDFLLHGSGRALLIRAGLHPYRPVM